MRQCLIDTLHSWRLAASAPATVRLLFPWEPGTSTAAPGRGSLDKEIMRMVIRSHLDEIRSCYEIALAAGGTLTGRVMVQFTIAADGNVIASLIQN